LPREAVWSIGGVEIGEAKRKFLLIRDANGKLLGPAAILRDVTAQWNQDKELRKRLTTLEARVKELNAD